MKRLCVFTGSRPGALPEYARAARELAGAILERKLVLVYGGSTVGLMGILADAVLGGGGEVIGVIPEGLFSKEVPHTGLTEIHMVKSMHERKQVMSDLADGFVALPGGVGTLEELTEIYTWGQLGLHQKPCGLLNIEGYYHHLICFLDHAVHEGFLESAQRDSLLVADRPGELLDKFADYRAPRRERWLDRAGT